MSNYVTEMSPADIAACTGNCNNNRGNGNGMFGDDWAWIIILLLFGYGGRGFGGFGGGVAGGNCGCGSPCATQADLAAGFNNSAVLSNLNGIDSALCQGFNGINTAILQASNGVDNAICTLGYQNQAGINAISSQLASCCCDIERGIERNTTQGVMNTNSIQKQISDCCCDLEMANMQNRFDAQTYNCNTLQAIDKLGDRIIGYMSSEKLQTLRDENQALRLAASQANQNAFITANQEAQTAELIRRLSPTPTPAYVVPNPNCCYNAQVSFGGCGCGNSCGF